MRSLLLICAALVVLGVTAPGVIQDYLKNRGEAGLGAAIIAPAAPQRSAGSGGREVAIKAGRDGHFYVDAEINFRAVRLMVDTGASVVALRQSDAEAAGIRVRPAEFDQPVSTANGVAYAAAAELDSVSVQDLEVSGVRALILPDDQLGVSLLGGSFLNRLARFQVADGTLIFEN